MGFIHYSSFSVSFHKYLLITIPEIYTKEYAMVPGDKIINF